MVSEAWKIGNQAVWSWWGTPRPENPYTEGTQDAIDWEQGFDIGCDDFADWWASE